MSQVDEILPPAMARKNSSDDLDVSEPSAMVSIRSAVLLGICVQNAGQALLMRYSRGVLRETYSSAEVVMASEVIKLVFSGWLCLRDDSPSVGGSGAEKLYWLVVRSQSMIALVLLFGVNNLAGFYALSKIDAGLFSVLTQLKTLTTASFSVLILQLHVSSTRWRALVILVTGCILVASPAFNKPADCSASSATAENNRLHMENALLGIGACVLIVVISGFASVYLEHSLKHGEMKLGIWQRNFQLSFWSVVVMLGYMGYESLTRHSTHAAAAAEGVVAHGRLFAGWSLVTVVITVFNAAGGLLVAATLKYADSVLKTLAHSGSIVLAAFAGWLLLNGPLDVFVVLGCVFTIVAIFDYSFDETVPP